MQFLFATSSCEDKTSKNSVKMKSAALHCALPLLFPSYYLSLGAVRLLQILKPGREILGKFYMDLIMSNNLLLIITQNIFV